MMDVRDEVLLDRVLWASGLYTNLLWNLVSVFGRVTWYGRLFGAELEQVGLRSHIVSPKRALYIRHGTSLSRSIDMFTSCE